MTDAEPADSADPAAPASAAARPENPDGYSLDYSLPAGFKTDVALGKIDPAHPTIAAARQFAHAEGLTQAQFSKMLGLYAQNVASEAQAYRASIARESQMLGPRAAERGAAVKTWLASKLGPEHAAALTARFTRASDIEAFEKLQGGDARAPAPQSIEARWYGSR